MDVIFIRAGFSGPEARIYAALLERGKASVSELAEAAKVKRANAYKVLRRLNHDGIVAEDSSRAIAHFSLENPGRLLDRLHAQTEAMRQAEDELRRQMPEIESQYRLVMQRPDIQFFEGPKGIERVIADSLQARTTIDSYVDVQAVEKYFGAVNARYVKERRRRKKHKRMLVQESAANRAYFEKLGAAMTEVRYLDYELLPLHAVMQIYDETISYLTLKPQTMIGIIIRDPILADMQRRLFGFTWQSAQV